MSIFTFEVVNEGKAAVVADVRSFSNSRAAWRHVEILALEPHDRTDFLIQVKNSEGRIVIMAGAAAATFSAETRRLSA